MLPIVAIWLRGALFRPDCLENVLPMNLPFILKVFPDPAIPLDN